MRLFVALVFLLSGLKILAQDPIEVKIEQRPSSLGVQTAFEMVVPQAKPEEAIELWKKTIIPGGLFKKSPKMEKLKDEWLVKDIQIEDITSLPLNVITQVSSFPGSIYVRIFLQSEGGFLGSSGSSQQTTEAAVRFIRKFGVDLHRNAVENELKAEEGIMKGLEKDLNKLNRQEDKFNKRIRKARNQEDDLKADAVRSEERLDISTKIAGDEISEATKESHKEMEKEIKSTRKDIKKARKTQSKFERKSRKIEKKQKDKIHEIEKQRVKMDEIRSRIQNIR